MKIVYLLDSICVLGGVEQITITKANALANINNNIIYIIVAEHRGTPFMEVNSKVNVINLNIQYYRDKGDSKLQGYKILLEERHKHKNKLSKILNEIAPDIVISTGKSEQYIITSINIKSNPILIREFHESKLFWDIVSKTLFEKIYNKIRHFYQKHFILNKFDKLIILNEEEKKYWKYTKKLCVIPNPTNVNHPFISNVKNKVVIAVGRLVNEKNFQSLISTWKEVIKIHPEWELKIWGDGILRNELQNQIISNNLQNNIHLKGQTHNILYEMSQSSFLVMTSISESFGLVLVEAMSCGLPTISYACPTGPIDIISNNINGYLVPVNDEKKLAEKIIYLIENENIRKLMSCNALLKAKEYSIDTIIQKNIELFNNLLCKKRQHC